VSSIGCVDRQGSLGLAISIVRVLGGRSIAQSDPAILLLRGGLGPIEGALSSATKAQSLVLD
jgi:hypothetical protein